MYIIQDLPATVRSRIRFFGGLLACALPFGALLWASSRYYINYPHSDEWLFIPLVEKVWNGTIPWQELYSLHNNHRLFLPRAVLLALIRWTDWDHRYPVGANIILGALIFGMAVFMLFRSMRRVGGIVPWAALPVLSILMFSLSQWLNWEWGWQIQIWMAVLAVYIGLAMLSSESLGWGHVCIAFICGVAATYSFGIGIVYWGGAFIVLAMRHGRGAPRCWAYLVLWLIGAFAVYGFYCWDFNQDVVRPPAHLIQANPVVLAGYAAVYIGAGIAYFRPWAALIAGAIGLLFAAWAHAGLWRARRVPPEALAPFTALMCISVGSALMTGMARARPEVGGIWQVFNAPRYITISILFWTGIVFLFTLMLQKRPMGDGWLWAHRWRRSIGGLGLLIMAACALLSSRQGYYNLDEHHKVYTSEVQRMIVQGLDEVPPRVRNPFVDYGFPGELAFLKRRHLSIYQPATELRWRQMSDAATSHSPDN